MRVLQLIDSLEPGGAERMAVNYANSLSKKVAFSGIVATRTEGDLRAQIDDGVFYLFLNRKKRIDVSAIFRLRKFVKSNKVSIIQAHSSSYFTAVLLKFISPSIKIYWHDHYGNSDFAKQRKAGLLVFFSCFFSGIIAVNQTLVEWSKLYLNCRNIVYLPNFVYFDNSSSHDTKLNGADGKRIILLANLRPQKNHLWLLEIVQQISESFCDWTFHLIGKDFNDDYSNQVTLDIKNRNLYEKVFLYGSKNDIANILSQCEIGILTSKSEGLPVSLLEYGYHGLPVIATDVGAISSVLKDNFNGFLVPSENTELFEERLCTLMSDFQKRQSFAERLQKTIFDEYTEESVVAKYLKFTKPEN